MHSEQLEKCGLYCKIQWKACPRPGLLYTYGPELAHQQPVMPSTQPEPYGTPRHNEQQGAYDQFLLEILQGQPLFFYNDALQVG